MQTKKVLVWLLLVAVVFVLPHCRPKPTDVFEGRVVNFKNEGLQDSEVEINGSKTKTGKDGAFILNLKKSNTTTFVVNARKDGFATYSQVINAPAKNLTLTLYEATVVSADPTKEIKVTDTNSKNRPGPRTASADWTSNPMAAVPLVVRNGKIVDLGFPADFGEAFDYLLTRKPGDGISITIPANSLVSASSQSAPSGNVNVAVSTIDLFSPNSMPGDYSVVTENRERGFLVSYGAGFIDIYDSKSRYQLKKGSTAQITIPVDASQLVYGDSLPSSIPLYLFDEKAGAWVDHGKASLSADKKSYTGDIRHFSTFNVDIEKATPACLGFQHTPAVAVPVGFTYNVEILAPQGGTVIHKTRTVTEPGDCLASPLNTGAHVVLRLPPNTDIGLIFFDAANNPLSVIVTSSSPSYDPAIPPACTPAGYENPDGSISCPSVTWDVITDPLIAVGLTTTTGVKQAKWVYKNFVAGNTYRIVAADASCVALNTTNVGGAQTDVTIAGGLKIVQADLPPASTGKFKVQALNGAMVLAESACVNF
jgi:hypothetical protein